MLPFCVKVFFQTVRYVMKNISELAYDILLASIKEKVEFLIDDPFGCEPDLNELKAYIKEIRTCAAECLIDFDKFVKENGSHYETKRLIAIELSNSIDEYKMRMEKQ